MDVQMCPFCGNTNLEKHEWKRSKPPYTGGTICKCIKEKGYNDDDFGCGRIFDVEEERR